MNFSIFLPSQAQEVTALFTAVFSESEGDNEGKVVGGLVADLIAKTEPIDLAGCVAMDNDRIVGCIFFSRLTVPSSQDSFILSPVAIATEFQGKGIGQKLIKYGLEYLKSKGVSLVFTYGDPNFYSKTGFRQISEKIVKAPFPLSQPIGWLAQSLDGEPIKAMNGTSQCVEALCDPSYW